MAGERRRALLQRRRPAPCAVDGGTARRLADVPGSAWEHSGEPGPRRAIDRGFETVRARFGGGQRQTKETFMTWTDFYLVCFLVGFGLSALALLAGSAHLHLPHLHMDHGIHIPHGHAGGIHTDLPFFNFGTIAAFLAWFGGTGYLLERYYSAWFLLTLGVAILSGIGAASLVFWFLAKVLMSREASLDPADYDMVGVLGKLTIPIRTGGTGELIYSQEGTRRVAGARSEDGAPIGKGAEVIVTRYEKGIAYVRPWEDPMDAEFRKLGHA